MLVESANQVNYFLFVQKGKEKTKSFQLSAAMVHIVYEEDDLSTSLGTFLLTRSIYYFSSRNDETLLFDTRVGCIFIFSSWSGNFKNLF